MRNRSKINVKNLPYTVVYTVDNIKKVRRFKDIDSAWSFTVVSGGYLNMAFRVFS